MPDDVTRYEMDELREHYLCKIDEKDAEIEQLRIALELPLMFYSAVWSDGLANRWKTITGTNEVTTKVMCDCIRRIIEEKK